MSDFQNPVRHITENGMEKKLVLPFCVLFILASDYIQEQELNVTRVEGRDLRKIKQKPAYLAPFCL